MSGRNIANRLVDTASRLGDRSAIHLPDSKSYSFAQVQKESDRYAACFEKMGISDGERALLMVRPGFDFITLSFALFKTGAVQVLIDPGMGKSNLLDCIKSSEPSALVAIPKAHFARLLYPKSFRSVTKLVTVGRRWLWGGETVSAFRRAPDSSYTINDSVDTAAILFTTGSTGVPKGVVYTHDIFTAQVDLIREKYQITDEDIDLPAFPLFALFSIAMGMSVVIPDMDPTRPADVDPQKIVNSVNEKGVTFTFGSPAIWRKVSRHCVENNIKLPSLKRVLMAGAPVDEKIHERLIEKILPGDGNTYTPFGATESLPVTDISGREVLAETAKNSRNGKGVCVGKPLQGMSIDIIAISDEPLEYMDQAQNLDTGVIGEIVAGGPVVTKEYFRLPEQTALAKIIDRESGKIFHRMGDVGYLDEKGRLWFCGRKNHRLITSTGTLYTIPCESIFNNDPSVFRTALVGLGESPNQTPIIIVEPDKGGINREETAQRLLETASKSELTSSIKGLLFKDEFPTDVRHNAKIFREKLKVWAEGVKEKIITAESL